MEWLDGIMIWQCEDSGSAKLEIQRMMALNEPQRRRLEVTLGLIEQRLRELELLYLSGADPSGELVLVENDLTEAEVEALTTLIGEMRQRIGRLRAEFELRPQQRHLRRILAALFSFFWSILHDCRSEKLGGTGRVDPALRQTLDPGLDDLIQLTQSMSRVIQRE